MASFFQQLKDAIAAWLGRRGKGKLRERENYEAPPVAPTSPTTGGKKFYIRSVGATPRPPDGARQRHSRFNLFGGTRPNQCPLCRTQKRITRGADQQWECKVCQYQWR